MADEAPDPSGRRSVVPQAAGRSLWLAAAWTGAGTAIVGAVVSIAGAAICWLPASGGSGNAGSALRAGILTFLAALHGGITVDGTKAAFLPLGLTLLVGALAWRAGSGLADAAADLDEQRRRPLLQAVGVQIGVFAVVCAVAAAAVALGTSSAPVPGVLLAAAVLFAVTGGVAFVRSGPLLDDVVAATPDWVRAGLRAAAAALTVYLAAGALLVAAALVVHRHQVEALSAQVGGGWSGAPVLLLGILAAPNAAVAGASYLAGPGFAVGSGSGVDLGSTVHGTLPAFPILGAVPSGPAGTPVWLLAAATPIAAGLAAVRVLRHSPTASARFRGAAAGAGLVALAGLVLAWQAGGGIGAGRLRAVGASPWQFGLAAAAAVAAVSWASLGGLESLTWWRRRTAGAGPGSRAPLRPLASASSDAGVTDDADQGGRLAG